MPGELPDDVGVPELVAVGGFDPAGLLYGVLAVATVIAAESTRHETFAKLLVASVVTMVLYWLAHAYSRHWASRLHRAREWTLKEIAASLWFEASILLGALLPTAVLVIAWAAGAGLETAVTALLWTAVFEIVVLEVVPAIRNRLRPKDLLVQTVAGVVLGVGILVLHLVLH